MKLVVFDCDGVLLDSEHLADLVVLDYCAGQFPAVDFSPWMERMTGLAIAAILRAMEKQHRLRFPADAEQRILTLLDRRLRDEVQPVAGVATALGEIDAPKAVASNSHGSYLHSLLGRAGLLDHFADRVYGADQVERGKPHPDIYLLAAARSGLTPGDCVAVEDSVPGVTAAVAAGLPTVGFIGGGHSGAFMADPLRRAGAVTVVEHMEQLPAVLRRCSAQAAKPLE